MLTNNPQIFSTYSLLFCKVVFSENTIKIVFSADHSFCVSQIVKTLLEDPTQNAPFQTKKCHFEFSIVSTETPIFVVFGAFLWPQKSEIFSSR